MESVERKKRDYRRKKIMNYSRSSEAAAGSIPLITHSNWVGIAGLGHGQTA